MPGFSLQWKATNPSEKIPELKKVLPDAKLKRITTRPVSPIVGGNYHTKVKTFIPENSYSLQEKNPIIYPVYKESGFPADTAKKQSGSDSLPIDENARKCGNNGMAALLTGIGSALLLAVGPGLETGTISYLVVVTAFILLMLLCIAFTGDAISFAFKAFKDFKKAPGKHSGFDTALKGLIAGILCLIYFTVIAIVFTIAAKVVF